MLAAPADASPCHTGLEPGSSRRRPERLQLVQGVLGPGSSLRCGRDCLSDLVLFWGWSPGDPFRETSGRRPSRDRVFTRCHQGSLSLPFPAWRVGRAAVNTPVNNPKHEQDTIAMTVLESVPSTVVGIDVSKATLVVFDQSHHRLMSIDNNRASIAKLIASFDPDTLVVCEPTGGHEAALVSELMAQGIACHRADTLKVQAFIKSFGRLAKTDAIDARALAQYGADRWKQLPLFKPKDEAQNQLAALVARREDLMAIKIAETNRMKAPGKNKTLARSFKTVLACVQRQIDRIDEEIENLIASSQALSRRKQICCSVPGVGDRTAIALLATMPELGTLTRRQAASLAGLAPHPRDSGTLKGYRKMRGGRPEVRKNVFMAALAGSRAKGPLSAFYQRLIENGKKPIVALSALMRKIIVILNAKIRDEINAMS